MRIEHWVYSVPLRLRSLLRRGRVEAELDEELAYHIERKTEEFVAQGMTPESARRAAVRSMDGLAQQMEACRDARRVNLVEHLIQDVRYGVRVLAKSPGFTAVAVLTLAVAIGANSVVFGVMNAMLLRPLDLPQAESLYSLQRVSDQKGDESYPTYLDLRERQRSFEDLAVDSGEQVAIDTGNGPARGWIQFVSGNYFDVLRIQPHAGRFFHSADEQGPNSAPYAVLTHGFWKTHFQEDPAVIGHVVRINKQPFTIIGVAPPEFQGPPVFFFPDMYVPIVNQAQISGTDLLHARNVRWIFQLVGHLKPGVTPEQATADVNAIGSWVTQTYAKEAGTVQYSLTRPWLGGEYFERPLKGFVAGLMLLAGLILLAACANLGSLFAARASDRGREVALRLALGASRNRVLRQLLTEAVILSTIGGALGIGLSVVLLRSLSAWQPLPRFPMRAPVQADATVYLVSAALAIVSGILFGLVPARQVRRTDPYQVIKAGPTGMAGRRWAMRDLLLTVQVAICALLVTSSMVAVRGLERSMRAKYGFDPAHTVVANVELTMAGYRGEEAAAMQQRLLDAAQSMPGVTGAALINTLPLDLAWQRTAVFSDDATDLRLPNARAQAFQFRISPGYLRTARTALLAGRDIAWQDDAHAPRIVLINRELARKMFGSVEEALGRPFQLRNGTRVQVAGIVEDGKYMSLTEDPQPAMFLPLRQSPDSGTWLVARSERDPQELAAAIRKSVRELDPGLPVFVVTWEQAIESALMVASRIATVALGILGALGAVLAVTGVFGMAAYSVSKRLKELGIRMALGAGPVDLLAAGLGRALRLLAVGSAAGVMLGVLFSRVLAAIVYGATPKDPLVLAGVVAAMIVVGLAATWVPARRAVSLDPARLLRDE
jgi:predicted permease